MRGAVPPLPQCVFVVWRSEREPGGNFTFKGKKVKLSLCFNRAPRHAGVLGEWKYSSIHSLTSALTE